MVFFCWLFSSWSAAFFLSSACFSSIDLRISCAWWLGFALDRRNNRLLGFIAVNNVRCRGFAEAQMNCRRQWFASRVEIALWLSWRVWIIFVEGRKKCKKKMWKQLVSKICCYRIIIRHAHHRWIKSLLTTSRALMAGTVIGCSTSDVQLPWRISHCIPKQKNTCLFLVKWATYVRYVHVNDLKERPFRVICDLLAFSMAKTFI